ncbi:DNA-binding protein [Streptomyces sp. NPDC060194]|uniref:DNA-binding protein n=1 Tax=Streptomyces sp. NPDC060194 TaxID=3347069 RepID=UPI003662A152
MARAQSRLNSGILLLDSEGLAKAVRADAAVTAYIRAAQQADMVIGVSILTLLEAYHSGVRMERFRWTTSRLEVVPVSEAIGWKAMQLLKDAGLHGHKYAIDSVVAATALSFAGARIIMTSDIDDIQRLCDRSVELAKV